MIIPAKFCPDAVIIPAFPDVLLNLKLPAARLPSLIRLSRATSAENVETPTALWRDLTSLNVKLSTLVITLPSRTPFINMDSSFKNSPFTSLSLTDDAPVKFLCTYPVAPLLPPSIWSPADNEVIAVETRMSVNVFISNKRVSNVVVSFTKLPDCALKS